MIRLYRLSTGEDVIGTPVEEGDPLQEGELENHIDFEYIKKYLIDNYDIQISNTWNHLIRHVPIVEVLGGTFGSNTHLGSNNWKPVLYDNDPPPPLSDVWKRFS